MELNADSAYEQLRWRHPARLVRLWPDLIAEGCSPPAATPIGPRPDTPPPDHRSRRA